MNELVYRGKDLLRPSVFLTVLGLLLVEALVAGLKFGPVGVAWAVGLTVAILAPSFFYTYRSWSSVGPAGITICWGGGKGRTYPWHEIRWIDVRETKNRGNTSYAVRFYVTGGRRRTLPGLIHSPVYPNPDFGAHFQRVVQWWEFSTDPAVRVQPPRTLRDKVSPQALGALLAVLIVVGVTLGVVLSHSG
ncbi:hypothetical protein [Streptomyces sp. Y1]|uniref:PH domain-containing protein n=1 Tax=Streptomyces sp. Y1 TaxID=3238634 RepID=A0AB39TWR8_9ACTN